MNNGDNKQYFSDNDPVHKIPLYSVANFSLPFDIWSAYWVVIDSFNSAKATYGRRCWLPVSDLLHKNMVLFYSLEPPLCTSQPRGHTGFDAARTRQPQWPTILILNFFVFCLSSFLLFLNLYALLPSPFYYCAHIYNQHTSVAQIFQKSRIRLNKQAPEGLTWDKFHNVDPQNLVAWTIWHPDICADRLFPYFAAYLSFARFSLVVLPCRTATQVPTRKDSQSKRQKRPPPNSRCQKGDEVSYWGPTANSAVTYEPRCRLELSVRCVWTDTCFYT